MTATVTDSTGTGTKTATVSWTQNGDEKVEKAGSDGKIPRKYTYIGTVSSTDNIESAGGTRTLEITTATVTKHWWWKYGGESAGDETYYITKADDAAYYVLRTSSAGYGDSYTVKLTRNGSTSAASSIYLYNGDKLTITAPA